MGIIQAFAGSLGGTFADQWKEVVTAGHFNEFTVVAPGVFQQMNNGRGTNVSGSVDVISNGSKILIPENTAAFIFSESGIEDVITQSGGYEFRTGQASVFNGDGFAGSIANQAADRFRYGGQTPDKKHIAFVNLREIRGIKFGTRGPMVYHDRYYGADLELMAFGTFSLQVIDPIAFVRNFLPANSRQYSFNSPGARQQLVSEFLQVFMVAVNSLSATHRVSELPSQVGEIAELISDDDSTLGSWIARYGLDVVQVGIENIEFSPESRELVKHYALNKMSITAFDGVSQETSNIAAQQKLAQGVQDHGLGDGGGMLFGMNLAQSVHPQTAAPQPPPVPVGAFDEPLSFDDQIETLKKLKDLLDTGVLTQEEFEAKKQQVLEQ